MSALQQDDCQIAVFAKAKDLFSGTCAKLFSLMLAQSRHMQSYFRFGHCLHCTQNAAEVLRMNEVDCVLDCRS